MYFIVVSYLPRDARICLNIKYNVPKWNGSSASSLSVPLVLHWFAGSSTWIFQCKCACQNTPVWEGSKHKSGVIDVSQRCVRPSLFSKVGCASLLLSHQQCLHYCRACFWKHHLSGRRYSPAEKLHVLNSNMIYTEQEVPRLLCGKVCLDEACLKIFLFNFQLCSRQAMVIRSLINLTLFLPYEVGLVGWSHWDDSNPFYK